MNRHQARDVLQRYRPGPADAQDPEMTEALRLAASDPELGAWFANHRAVQEILRRKFLEIPIPAHLKEAVLAQRTIIAWPAWWTRRAWLAAAAGLAGLIALTAHWLAPTTPHRFADFRSRMVRTVLRQYGMDLETPDMARLRAFLAARGAPADYQVPAGLERLVLTGGGVLKWRSAPVSMVCFDRRDRQMLFFVLERAKVQRPPPREPQFAKVNKLLTVSWSSEDKAYLLAGPEEPQFATKYWGRP